ncbi:MAG: putative metal-binding motif-containing protein [Alphaproteobacteria bacterium]|nr:putative metal-binding motif-containing protein [Alphaproteobacteria bacterium]
MRPSSLLVVLFGAVTLSACGDTGLSTIIGELQVNPTLTDIEIAPVGLPHFFNLTLNTRRADIELNAITVDNVDGQFFMTVATYVDRGGVLPEGIEPVQFPLKVTPSTVIDVPMVYFPLSEGYHLARVTFGATGRDQELTVQARGRADTPAAVVYPGLVDFGEVKVGTTGVAEVYVENRSELQLAITTSFNDDHFWTSEDQPEIYGPLEERKYVLHYDPTDEEAASSNVIFSVGNVTLASIQMIANDCRNGLPEANDADHDGYTRCSGDCDDTDPGVHPGVQERANQIDDDCNGIIDDNTISVDDDGDGYCDADLGETCLGTGILPGDCNDGDPTVNPGEEEDCPGTDPACFDGKDNDCNGITDGGTTDQDGDGYTEAAGDCYPQDPTSYPGARELPDGIDNDCDNIIDEGTVLYDDDGDGYCEGLTGWAGCTVGDDVGDCDDTAEPPPSANRPGRTIYPGAPEWVAGNPAVEDLYRGIDNDCDGTIDEGTNWADDDHDGYTEDGGDCDDSNPARNPGELELGLGNDEDCDPSTP